jgi:hypothetical protein
VHLRCVRYEVMKAAWWREKGFELWCHSNNGIKEVSCLLVLLKPISHDVADILHDFRISRNTGCGALHEIDHQIM